jgi:hypothetical protein
MLPTKEQFVPDIPLSDGGPLGNEYYFYIGLVISLISLFAFGIHFYKQRKENPISD